MANTHSLDLELSSSQYAYITDASQTGLDITDDISIEAWCKIEQLPSTAGSIFSIITKDDTAEAGNRSYALYIDDVVGGTNDNLVLIYFDSSSNLTRCVSDAAAFVGGDVGQWVHIAVTVDVSTQTVTMYKNGSSIACTNDSSAASSIRNGGADVRIGARKVSGSLDQFYDGLIDEVRVWNDIRTAQEISDNFEKELVGNETGLVGYWKFNNNAEDTTSNNNDLTLSGSPSYSSDVPGWSLTSAIQAYWKLDESSGNAADSVGSYTLTNTGSVAYSSGKINNGADFTPDDSLNNNSVLAATSYPRSFTGWAKFDTITGNDRTIFSLGDGAVHYYVLRVRDSDDHIVFRANNNTEAADVDTGITASTATWYHWAVIQNSAISVTIYINNVATNTATATFSATVSQFYLGYLGRSSVWWMDGMIDEVGIWSRALTVDEISQLYNSGAGKQYPFLGTAYSLVMALGTFTLTGIDVIFNKTISMIMATGSFALTGIDALFKIGKGFIAEVGRFILTGKDALLNYSGWTQDTKPTTSWTEDSEPTTSWTNDSK